MKRYLDFEIQKDLDSKLVILTGPRQVGKTTLSRHLATQDGYQYLNWDIPNDRQILQAGSWDTKVPLLIFDEIHKMPNWKTWLKGVADARISRQAQGKSFQKILVTGSARMDTYRQTGESLAGRYFAWRLHPISVKELVSYQGMSAEAALDHLMLRGGFPEPCLASTGLEANRWRQQYFTDLVREDVLEFSRIHEISAMRTFVEMLRDRVGSPLSLASMARDLQISSPTLKKYLEILEALYIVFVVHPWHQNIARSLLQAPKVYFYDTAYVRGDEGIRFENAVANMLLKHSNYLEDSLGQAHGLHYIRNKEGGEIDFVLTQQEQITHLIECKLSKSSISKTLRTKAAQFSQAEAIQLTRTLDQTENREGVWLKKASDWLNELAA